VALGLLPGGWAHPCPHVALGSCLSVGHTPAHMWRLGPASMQSTTLRARGAWAVCLGAWHTLTHTWCLDTPIPNYPWALHVKEPKIALGLTRARPK